MTADSNVVINELKKLLKTKDDLPNDTSGSLIQTSNSVVLETKTKRMNDSQLEELIELYGFKPAGTTNYLFSVFNLKTRDRTLLFEGATPLHEAIPKLYDFIYMYINNNKHQNDIVNEVFSLTTINPPRDTHTIIRLPGLPTKKQRVDEVNSGIDILLKTFDSLLSLFLNGSLLYRSDTILIKLKDTQNIFNTKTKVKINNLLN